MSEVERDPLEAARARKAHAFKMFIYCDDPSHPRRIAVTNFIALPDGGWHEEPSSRASKDGAVGTGRTIVDDTLPGAGWANQPSENHQEIRDRFELVCRKCRRRPVLARKENLFPVLDGWRAAGVSEVALAVIGASLQRKSED